MRSSLLLRQIARRAALRQTPAIMLYRTPHFLTTASPLFWTTTTNTNDHWNIRTFSSSPELIILEDDHNKDDQTETETETEQPRRFEDLDLHPKSLKALRRHGLHNLTEIQEKTFDVVVSGKDVVGRARTGTGKTLAFLLPALERIVRQQENNPKPGIQLLVLSPTRELAAQIAKEAERLVLAHDKNITSQVIYGGSPKREDIDRFHRRLPTILVATPGRLKDHLASTNLRNKPFVDALANLQTLVLDETDRLLDMGFRKDIQDILSSLPKGGRQTLLFSATLPRNVRAVVELANKPDYVLVDCIQDEDPATHTNAQIEQTHIILPADRFWTGSMEVLLDLMDQDKSKIMVFFPMTSLLQLYSSVFNLRFGRRVWELHGKMHQKERTTISGRFRNASKGILFTSDVSARGVDYPNVTTVVQIGAADSRETYIHRLGRTGRAGKRGQGLLILPELEQDFLEDLEGLDIPQDDGLQKRLSGGASKKFMNEMGPVAHDVRSGKDPKLKNAVHDAYQAMVAFYYHRYKHLGDEFVSTVNRLVEDLGLTELPAIDLNRARRIGIDDIPGLNIQQSWKDKDNSWTDGRGEQSRANSGSIKPFGKPYGDFDGKFEPRDRRNSWEAPDSPRDNSDGGRAKGWAKPAPPRNQRNSSDESDSFHSGSSRQSPRSDRPSENHSGGRRTGRSRSSEQPAKVGFKKDPFGTFGHTASNKKKKKGSFQRWESPASRSKKS